MASTGHRVEAKKIELGSNSFYDGIAAVYKQSIARKTTLLDEDNMTSLVLGGSGFIGQHIIGRLLSAGECVVATSRTHRGKSDAANLLWRKVHLASFDDWPSLLSDVSTVYHLAWSTIPRTAVTDPIGDIKTNVVGSLRLMEALRSRSSTRLVFVSSGGAVYGQLKRIPASEDDPANPTGAYGISKLAVEHYIRQYAHLYGIDAVILRLGNPFGPGQRLDSDIGAVATFCSRALANRPIVFLGDGSIVRDYFHVEDALDALLLAAKTRSSHRTFNIGSGSGHSLNDIVTVIGRILGRKIAVEYHSARPFDIQTSVLNVTRANTELGWKPRISFEEGISRMLGVTNRG